MRQIIRSSRPNEQTSKHWKFKASCSGIDAVYSHCTLIYHCLFVSIVVHVMVLSSTCMDVLHVMLFVLKTTDTTRYFYTENHTENFCDTERVLKPH